MMNVKEVEAERWAEEVLRRVFPEKFQKQCYDEIEPDLKSSEGSVEWEDDWEPLLEEIFALIKLFNYRHNS